MLDIADRIAAINEQQLNAGNEQVVGLLRGFQTRLAVTLLAALAWAWDGGVQHAVRCSDWKAGADPVSRKSPKRANS